VGSCYNGAQSSKNRANVFVTSNTINICLGSVVQLFHCVIFFCFITYHATSCMATSVNRRMLFSVVCFFVCSLFNDAFQYLRLYSVDFYSSLIRLPSSSKAGGTRVRNLAAEFCRRAPIMLVGFFTVP
jgi:hypothetical protein